jgi:stage III sporulation protein AB
MTSLRLVGAVLVLLSSSLLGIVFSEEAKKKITLLCDFRSLLCIIRSGMEYNRQMLPQILSDAVYVTSKEASAFAGYVADGLMMEEKTDFYAVWEEAVEHIYGKSVIREETELLKEAGKIMGLMDLKLRISGIDSAVIRLDDKIRDEQAALPEKCRMRRNLGMIFGVFLIIVFL